MVSICFHFGLLVALFGSFVVCDDRASLSSVSEVIRNNKESITKINDTLISLMESRQLGMCGQEVILKEEEMFQKSGEILSLAIATFNSLEISLRELTAQIDKNNCDQERRSNCSRGEWTCGSGECIPDRSYCDGRPDCQDSSDEASGCQVQCSEDEFKCEADNECLPSQWVCDGEEDCSDGSDEETCPSVQCSENEFMCEADNECLPSQWVCDGEEDCSDGSDEETCPSVITTTPPPGNERKDDPCTDHRCSHDCLASPLSPEGYTCLCPKGMALFHDRLTCVLPFTKRPFVEYLEVKNNIGSPFSGVKGATH